MIVNTKMKELCISGAWGEESTDRGGLSSQRTNNAENNYCKECLVSPQVIIVIPALHTIKYENDDVIKWKHFPRYWPFVRGIHRSPVNSQHKGQWRGALVFSLICAWMNGWVNNSEAGDLRCHRAHYDVTVMWSSVHACRLYQVYMVQQGTACMIWLNVILNATWWSTRQPFQ